MRMILELLKQIAHGFSVHFGSNCEILIHDLTNGIKDSSIIYIENGHVSKRKIGDGPSGIVLEAAKKNMSDVKDQLSYLTRTEDGRILKSSTLYIRNEEGHIDYIMSLNYDITSMVNFDETIKDFITPSSLNDSGDKTPITITNNVNMLLDSLIEQSVHLVGKPVSLMTKDDKIAAVTFLNDSGAFLITKSGDKISNYFGISKFTLYSYLDLKKQKDKEQEEE